MSQQLTPVALENSVTLYQQALAIDPEYAPAWVGLAAAYQRQVGQGLRPFNEGYGLSREASMRALEIDAANAAAHRSLAWIAQVYDRDVMKAARHYQLALALDPTSVSGAAHMSASLGRLDQAIALEEYAVARDPIAPIRHSNLGLYYLRAGRLDEAIASLQATLTLSPGYIGAQYFMGTALMLKGDLEHALATVQKEDFEVYRLIGLVTTYHALGKADESDAALAELIEKYEHEWAYNIAYALAFRGQADLAFEWLQKAIMYNDPGLAEIAAQPLFASVKNDSRWVPFLESIGKSPKQLATIEFDVPLLQ